MKLDLSFVNWLCCISDKKTNLVQLANYYSHADCINKLRLYLGESASQLFIGSDDGKVLTDSLNTLRSDCSVLESAQIVRDFFCRKHWLAAVIPSGNGMGADQLLSASNLLNYLVCPESSRRGVIFQFDESIGRGQMLFNVSDQLCTALADSTHWPGVLVWAPGGDSVFLSLGSDQCLEIDFEARLQWIFSQLSGTQSLDLGRLKLGYIENFPELFDGEVWQTHVLQLSDLFIGKRETSLRLQHLKHVIAKIISEVGEHEEVLPVISGNLLAGPSDIYSVPVGDFWHFLTGLGIQHPALVFGNQDVRKDGNINESYRNVIGFQNKKVLWYETEKLGLICINSVVHGNLPNGLIEREQIDQVKQEISLKKDAEDYDFVIVLHHMPVRNCPDAALSELFTRERVSFIETLQTVENSDMLLQFVHEYQIKAILHGNLKFSLFDCINDNIPVVGCGRTTGIRSEIDGHVYFVLNLISLNRKRKILTCRQIAIRNPERGFFQPVRHESFFCLPVS